MKSNIKLSSIFRMSLFGGGWGYLNFHLICSVALSVVSLYVMMHANTNVNSSSVERIDINSSTVIANKSSDVLKDNSLASKMSSSVERIDINSSAVVVIT